VSQVLRRWAGPLLVAATMAAGATGAAQGPKKPRAATTPAKASSFVNRVWVVVASGGVAPGTLYVFLSDGALVISSKGNPPGVGRWSGSATGLVLTEEGRDYKADVVELTVDRFRLRVHNPGEPTDITFAPAAQRAEGDGDPGPGAVSPLPTTYRCGDETFKLAFEDGMAYVTAADGATLTLPRLRQSDEAAARRTYTNGRMTFIEVKQGAVPEVLFARGRMALQRCANP
jgi:hypothetical protein